MSQAKNAISIFSEARKDRILAVGKADERFHKVQGGCRRGLAQPGISFVLLFCICHAVCTIHEVDNAFVTFFASLPYYRHNASITQYLQINMSRECFILKIYSKLFLFEYKLQQSLSVCQVLSQLWSSIIYIYYNTVTSDLTA